MGSESTVHRYHRRLMGGGQWTVEADGGWTVDGRWMDGDDDLRGCLGQIDHMLLQ